MSDLKLKNWAKTGRGFREAPMGGPLARLDGLGRAAQYTGVAKFQTGVAMLAETLKGVFPAAGEGSACLIPDRYTHESDGRWGDETQAIYEYMLRWIYDWHCGLPGKPVPRSSGSKASALSEGPRVIMAALTNGCMGPALVLTTAEVNEMQLAWTNYKAKEACKAAGGTWNDAALTCTPGSGGGGGGGGGGGNGGGGGGGDGGGGDQEEDYVPVVVSKPGWLGPICLAVDLIGGFFIAAKKW